MTPVTFDPELKTFLRRYFERAYSDAELRQWFDPLAFGGSSDHDKLLVYFPHAFFAEWFQHAVQAPFEERLAEALGSQCVVAYQSPAPSPGLPPDAALSRPTPVPFPFQEAFTFSSFLYNDKNYFPMTMAKEVATQQEVSYNPFLISGGNGSGKTHLLRAMANEISQTLDRNSIFFGSIEDIFNTYQHQFSGDTFRARNYFSKFRCLLVDDLQLIKNLEQLQHELIALYNYFFENKLQMIFCCTERVSNCSFLNPFLRSRLEFGLNVHINQPDIEIRLTYIQNFCKVRSLKLTKANMAVIAQHFLNFRSIQGILIKIAAYKGTHHSDLSDNDFSRILQQTDAATTKVMDPHRIVRVVADHFSLSEQELTGPRRRHDIVFARQVAMFLCRELAGASYPTLGKFFGGKDHSTAMYSVLKIQKLQTVDKDMHRLLTDLKQTCAADRRP